MEVRSVLPRVWEVPEEFRARLGDRPGRQRAMFADGHLLLVLHKAPEPNEVQRQGRYFWRHPDGTWKSSEFGGGAAAISKHLAEYSDVLQDYDQQEDRAATAADYFQVLEGVAPLHRAASHMHSVLQEARKQISADRGLINLRDQAYEIERTADLLYTNTKNGLDFAIARRAEEEARMSRKMAVSAHRLNVLVAFFFPVATLCAIFGVNLEHGLERYAPPLPLLAIVALGLLCGAVLATIITRPSRQQEG
ncbi:hypothetical protein SH139x_002539 [Planctomycetaceae bacterium SH139]